MLTLVSLLVLTGAFVAPVVGADDPAAAPKAEKPPSKSDLKKYDKNHDGMLDADELAARQADKDKAKAERKAKADAKKAEKAKEAPAPIPADPAN